jgi:circadian clock protein KaiB
MDVYQQPILARDGQIVATPKPVRRLIGDLTHIARLFVGFDFETKSRSRP